MVKLRAVRRFLLDSFGVEAGEVLELNDEHARKMLRRLGNKVEILTEQKPEPEAGELMRPAVRNRMAAPSRAS